MAGCNYLDGAENLYGLPSPLPAGLGEQASAVVDAYLKRPEGMVYVMDANGNPSFMKGMQPSFTFRSTGAIAPGQLVSVSVSPAVVRQDHVGEVFVIDRKNPDALETVVVQSIVAPSTLVLANVQFSHASGCALEQGLVIVEERQAPSKRSIVRYSKFPCPTILSLQGRYAYGRRSDQIGGLYQEMNLLAAVQTFGGPPQWITIPIAQASWSDATGEIWVPAGLLLAYYSDVKVQYVAGFPEDNLPEDIVRATAQVAAAIKAAQVAGGPSVQVVSAGDSRIQRFNASYMDEDTKRLLERYKARVLY